MIWSLICLNCRRPAPRALCLACWRQVLPTEPQLLELEVGGHPFSHWAYGSYQGVLKALLYQLKYHHRKALGKALGLYLGEWLESKDLIYDWIVPVPLHIQRQKERGFNQAEFLARGVS